MTSKEEIIKVYTFESNSAGGIMAILLYVKANFKVKKLDVDEWDVKKNKFEYEALPIIKINKVQYTHEIPIILYLGKKYNLLGDDVENEYLCSNILYAINELSSLVSCTDCFRSCKLTSHAAYTDDIHRKNLIQLKNS